MLVNSMRLCVIVSSGCVQALTPAAKADERTEIVSQVEAVGALEDTAWKKATVIVVYQESCRAGHVLFPL